MKPQTIFLIRHGESLSNEDPSIHERVPDHKIELTERGRGQSREAAAKLYDMIGLGRWKTGGQAPPTLAVYLSPFARTRQTYTEMKRLLEPHVVSEYEDPRLREQEYGHLRGMAEADKIDAEREAYSRFYYRIPDGESGADCFDRAKGFLETLYRDFEKEEYPQTVLIIGHGFQMRILLMAWLHWPVEEFEMKRNLRNAEILQLNLDRNGKYQLITPLEKE